MLALLTQSTTEGRTVRAAVGDVLVALVDLCAVTGDEIDLRAYDGYTAVWESDSVPSIWRLELVPVDDGEG